MPRPLPNPPAKLEDSTREIILAAATELFGARGFDGVHMRDIAARVELTMPAIYYHFRSKEHLYEAVMIKATEHFRGVLDEAMRGTITTRDRLVAVLKANFKIAFEMPALIRLFYQIIIGPFTDSRKPIYVQAVRDAERLVRTVLEEGIARGEVRPGVSAEAVVLVMGAVTSYNMGLLAFGTLAFSNSDAERLVDAALRGIGNQNGE